MKISILDLNLSVKFIVLFFLFLAFILIIFYFIITFSIFKNKKKYIKFELLKIKKEVFFNKDVEYFEKEFFLSKSKNDEN